MPSSSSTPAFSTFRMGAILRSIRMAPERVPKLQKKHWLFLILSASGLATALLFYLYRRRRSLALQSRSKSAAPTAGGRRPVGHVDPRRPSTSSVASGGRRLVSNEERHQHHRARRERSRISRASSIDRMSVSSARSNRTAVEDSVQLLGELNMSHYSEVLTTFQADLESALFQYANRKQHAPSTGFSNLNKLAPSGTLGSDDVNHRGESGSAGVNRPQLGSTPVNSKELISKLQKLLDLASELHQKNELDRSRDSIQDGAIIEEDPIEETLAQLGLRSTSYHDNGLDSELDDDNSSTLSFRSVDQDFPTSPFGSDAENADRGQQSTASASNTFSRLPNSLISKIPFMNGGPSTSATNTKMTRTTTANKSSMGSFGGHDESSHKANGTTSSPNPFPVHQSQSHRSTGASYSVVDDQYLVSSQSNNTSRRLSSGQQQHSVSHQNGHVTMGMGMAAASGQMGPSAELRNSVTTNYTDPSTNTTLSSYHSAGFNTYAIASPLSGPFLSAIGSPTNEVASSHLLLYEQGLNAVNDDAVPCRVLRAELLNLGSDSEFLAKLFGIRKSLSLILAEPSNRDFLKGAGRRLVSDFLMCCNHSPAEFQTAFDEIIRFCDEEQNWPTIEDELSHRGVVDMNFFDIVIDFIFLDAFDDLESPPSSIVNVLQNRWLSQSFKETALRTAVWSVLKAKRSRLRYTDGFINRFYSVSEVMSPLFAYGFLGPPGDLQDLCLFFKSEILDFVRKMFDQSLCRYTSQSELAEDLLALARNKIAIVTQRFSEILPATT
ncbi:uncharacterized protein LOC134850960 isoform X2 [Symsagittifera roscoffensis]|uniref:uncharacterized protein LOC134850960 isoform X2 n=1 Tax=Symsagittifera roscoffensis TaxID=84072 RepID=UPI00307BBA02